MKKSSRFAVVVYLLLTIINVVVFGVELNYGTVKDLCRHEISMVLDEVNAELEAEENLTDEKVLLIKQKYGISNYGNYVIDSATMVQDCVREKAWFDLEF